MAAVVDTDVFSFIFKNDTRKAIYERHLKDQFLFLSFMTVAELHRWGLASGLGDRKKLQLEMRLRRYDIQHSTPDLCELWAEITDEAKRNGKPIAVGDAWIAATAIFLDVPLITNNASDFHGVSGLTIITETI